MMQHKEETGTKKDLVLYRIQTSRDNLKAARILFQAEEYKGANNRAYYAIFHAINAIHAVKGKAYKRHKDAIANFNKEYVKTEIFPREMGRKISEAEEIRHASDYDDFYVASREEAERQITVADEFMKLSEKYCLEELEKEERDSVPDQNVDEEVDINDTIDSLTGCISIRRVNSDKIVIIYRTNLQKGCTSFAGMLKYKSREKEREYNR